ncbi:MAG: tRNA pseudouridine(38-40) synthase TruA [Deltaproteobacteria bacterium]|nr:tRNA pseudouridine(38-40) synthase TruA [Deltaproteobacteria bacterium]
MAPSTALRSSRRFPHWVRLRLAYDGTDFSGWQRQPGQRTVQGEFNRALDRVGIPHSGSYGASRTDAGVHAEAQAVSFGASRELAPGRWILAINGELPDDMAVRTAVSAPYRYDPRYDALEKTYRYLVQLGPTRDPLWRQRALWLGPRLSRHDLRVRRACARDWLDLDAMQKACETLEGQHDFRAFRSYRDRRDETHRTLLELRLEPDVFGHTGLLGIRVRGDGFMHNMVRILAGTLLDVGRMRIRPEDIAAMLGPEATRRMAGPTAPARGLTLVSMILGADVPPEPD